MQILTETLHDISYDESSKQFVLKNGVPLFGAALVRVLPPKKLLFPILPFRSDISKRVSLPLCKICADQQFLGTCNHSPWERSWCAVYTTEDINYAKSLGYEILAFFEAQNFKKRAKPFDAYIKTLAHMKIKVSKN